jgi:hypothetical protein
MVGCCKQLPVSPMQVLQDMPHIKGCSYQIPCLLDRSNPLPNVRKLIALDALTALNGQPFSVAHMVTDISFLPHHLLVLDYPKYDCPSPPHHAGLALQSVHLVQEAPQSLLPVHAEESSLLGRICTPASVCLFQRHLNKLDTITGYESLPLPACRRGVCYSCCCCQRLQSSSSSTSTSNSNSRKALGK